MGLKKKARYKENFIPVKSDKQWASAASVLGGFQDPAGPTALNSLV